MQSDSPRALVFAYMLVAVGFLRLMGGRGLLDAAIWWAIAAVVLVLHLTLRRRRR